MLYFLSGLTCTRRNFLHQVACAKVRRGTRAHADLARTRVRASRAFRAMLITGTSGIRPGFMWTPRRRRGRRTIGCTVMSCAELPEIVAAHLPADPSATGIFGHSMGGHGALTLALRNPSLYKSVSAFSPIAAPMQSPWGKKAFTNYLGPDIETWREHDATELVARRPYPGPILIDQGSRGSISGCGAACRRNSPRRRQKSGQQLNAAHAAGLRSRLLLHPDLHGGSFAPSRGAARECAITAAASGPGPAVRR